VGRAGRSLLPCCPWLAVMSGRVCLFGRKEGRSFRLTGRQTSNDISYNRFSFTSFSWHLRLVFYALMTTLPRLPYASFTSRVRKAVCERTPFSNAQIMEVSIFILLLITWFSFRLLYFRANLPIVSTHKLSIGPSCFFCFYPVSRFETR